MPWRTWANTQLRVECYMSFRFLSWLFVPLLAYSAAVADPLKVCADPNNLPFSNREGEGLENKLAEFIGHGIHRQVEFVWWSERKNFAQHSLEQGACDVVLGVPSTMPGVLTTAA